MGLQWCPGRVVGHSLVWDVACPDTFAHSYLATSKTGALAAHAEERKVASTSNPVCPSGH